jgi:peptidoglycan hydrolase CwlO-like protein
MEIFNTVLVSSITGIVSFFVGQRRAQKETEGIYLKNIEHSISIYQTIIADLRGEMEGMMKKIDKLESKIDDLVKENRKLEKIVKDYQNANTNT